MELNLNELERRAKSAGGQEWTLTIDATGDAFLSAENSEYVADVGAVGEDGIVSDYGKFIAAANPAVVLELVRRLREAEHRVAELEAERTERENQEPLFWYRPRMDDGYEGPLHDSQIEQVRRESGAWVPLIAKPLQPPKGE